MDSIGVPPAPSSAAAADLPLSATAPSSGGQSENHTVAGNNSNSNNDLPTDPEQIGQLLREMPPALLSLLPLLFKKEQ